MALHSELGILSVEIQLKSPRKERYYMDQQQANNPLHGITLEMIMNRLVDHYGWEGLARKINLNCFKNNPSIKSSLTFLRKTPWAREKAERLFLKIH